VCSSDLIIGQDTGATTGFLYFFQMREKVYEIYEEVCGDIVDETCMKKMRLV
jgi:NADH-quinone oxidoreductase subunit D